ncbi:MAG: glycosyltransferase family 4 protein [Chthoniobacterales bacterium]
MPEKRRLLFVSHEMTLSGAPIHLAHLAQWLRARGWEITVVAPEPGPLGALLDGIAMSYDPQLLIDPYYGALRKLAPQFDLVLANTVATWEAVQACHLEGVPVVWYLHETQVGLQLMQLVHMIAPSLPLADAVVTPTQRTAAIYAPHRHAHVEVIPYGIPPVAPLPHASHSPLRFVTIGTYEHRKGQDILLDAIVRLPSDVRERVRFQIAGRELEPVFCRELRARSNDLHVQLEGALSHVEALRLLSQADALVLPSRDETMPIVLLEAMSLGKAVIATEVGGIAEWIDDGHNGLLVPPENPTALAEAITRLANDPGFRGLIGIAGRNTFDEHFTIERCGARFESVLLEVLEQDIAGTL